MDKNVKKLKNVYKKMTVEVAEGLIKIGDVETKEEYLKLTEKMCREVDAKFYVRIHKILTNMEAEGMSPKQLEKVIGDVILSVVMDKKFLENLGEMFEDEDEA